MIYIVYFLRYAQQIQHILTCCVLYTNIIFFSMETVAWKGIQCSSCLRSAYFLSFWFPLLLLLLLLHAAHFRDFGAHVFFSKSKVKKVKLFIAQLKKAISKRDGKKFLQNAVKLQLAFCCAVLANWRCCCCCCCCTLMHACCSQARLKFSSPGATTDSNFPVVNYVKFAGCHG